MSGHYSWLPGGLDSLDGHDEEELSRIRVLETGSQVVGHTMHDIVVDRNWTPLFMCKEVIVYLKSSVPIYGPHDISPSILYYWF